MQQIDLSLPLWLTCRNLGAASEGKKKKKPQREKLQFPLGSFYKLQEPTTQEYCVVFYNNGSFGAEHSFYYSCFMSHKW